MRKEVRRLKYTLLMFLVILLLNLYLFDFVILANIIGFSYLITKLIYYIIEKVGA